MKSILFAVTLLIVSNNVKAGYPSNPIPVTATETNPYGGGYSKALVYTNCVNIDRKVRKPLIVFEGYDPGYFTKPKEKEGFKGIEDFLNDLKNDVEAPSATLLQQLLQGNPLVDPAINQQYDIVYVNWVNGTDYLENNEKVAKKVIMEVNRWKADNNSTEPNVIIGRSMGAVIARMALKHMENDHAAHPTDPAYPLHQTRQFISNDGGQQGSNIPQGYQRLANHFRDLYIKTGPLALALEGGGGTVNFAAENISFINRVGTPLGKLSVNETPASRQLQINHLNLSNDIDNSLHESFLASLNTLGYPSGDGSQAFDMIAVSNGSECAKPQDVGSGGELMNYDGTVSTTMLTSLIANVGFGTIGGLTGGIGVSAFAFPPLMIFCTIPGTDNFDIELKVNAKADNVGNQVYKGKISYVKKVLGIIPVPVLVTNKSHNANSSTLAYDYFPGGNQDLSGELGLPESGDTYFLEKSISFTHVPYCHVPVPSALDIGQGNVTLAYADYFTPYVGASPPGIPKTTAFTDGFITAFNGGPDNEGHTQINRRNGDWMAQWLNGSQPVPLNCSFACTNPTISGPEYFCASPSGAYSVPNLPSGASVIWSSSNNSIATPNTPGNPSTTLQKNGDGSITLTAIVSGCGALEIKKENISVGIPNTPGPITLLLIDLAGGKIHAEIDDVPGATSYNWYKNSAPTIHHGTAAVIPISKVNCDIYYDISVEAVNDCGTSPQTHENVWVPCDNLMMISPNPSSGDVIITADASKIVGTETAYFDNVKLYDMQGNLKKSWKFNKVHRGNINISAFTSGQYYLEISCGNYKERKLLLLQK